MFNLLKIRHKCIRFLGKHSSVFFALVEMRRCLGYTQGMPTVTPETELVIEGFFRSANSFATRAFLTAQRRTVIVAHRSHVPATILRAARWNIPTLVLIRQPRDAVLSYMLKWPYLSAEDGFREYIAYYTAISPLRDHYVVASFEEVTGDFGMVIDRVNRRFNTSFELFRHTPENVQHVFTVLKRMDRGAFGVDVAKVSVPVEEKNAIKARYRRTMEAEDLQPLIAEAERVYQNFLAESAGRLHREIGSLVEARR